MRSPLFSLFIFLLVLLQVTLYATSTVAYTTCVDCMDGMPMDGCPIPEFCGFKPTLCVNCPKDGSSSPSCKHPSWCVNVTCNNCMDSMPMPGCPDPGTCGFIPINCTDCMNGMAMPGCPHPDWCGFAPIPVPNFNCSLCMGGMPMDGCPNPDFCGLKPIECVDCPKNGSAGPMCKHPNWCQGVTCNNCMDSMPMPGCPDPGTCGFKPLPCTNCMNGMAMPGCPHPDWCGFAPIQPTPTPTPTPSNSTVHCTGCVDGTYTSTCPNPEMCGYKPIICTSCPASITPSSSISSHLFSIQEASRSVRAQASTCSNATWCQANHITCNNCMDNMPMNGCPFPGSCGYQPLLCTGCVPGVSRTTCPDPTYCGNVTTPPCMGCIPGTPTQYCPDPTACGATTPSGPQCINCMCGMAMPQCPDPTVCNVGCGSSDCMMNMYFSVGMNTCVLLSSWHITNSWQWALTSLAIFVLALFREGVGIYRSHRVQMRRRAAVLQRKANMRAYHNQVQTSAHTPDKSTSLLSTSQKVEPIKPAAPPSALIQFEDSFLYFLSLVFAYLLMLIIMTYNIGLCLIVVFALFVAHFLIHYTYSVHQYNKHQHEQAKQTTPTSQSRDEAQESSTSRKRKGWSSVSQTDADGKSSPPAVEATAPSGAAYLQPTSGDHCCEDIDIEDD